MRSWAELSNSRVFVALESTDSVDGCSQQDGRDERKSQASRTVSSSMSASILSDLRTTAKSVRGKSVCDLLVPLPPTMFLADVETFATLDWTSEMCLPGD